MFYHCKTFCHHKALNELVTYLHIFVGRANKNKIMETVTILLGLIYLTRLSKPNCPRTRKKISVCYLMIPVKNN